MRTHSLNRWPPGTADWKKNQALRQLEIASRTFFFLNSTRKTICKILAALGTRSSIINAGGGSCHAPRRSRTPPLWAQSRGAGAAILHSWFGAAEGGTFPSPPFPPSEQAGSPSRAILAQLAKCWTPHFTARPNSRAQRSFASARSVSVSLSALVFGKKERVSNERTPSYCSIRPGIVRGQAVRRVRIEYI